MVSIKLKLPMFYYKIRDNEQLFTGSTGASDRNFYPIFNNKFDYLETLLTIHRPKKVLSAGSLCGSPVLMPQNDLYITPKASCSSFKYVIIATWMFHKERKLTYISGAKPGSDPLPRAGSRALFYPMSIIPQISTEHYPIL